MHFIQNTIILPNKYTVTSAPHLLPFYPCGVAVFMAAGKLNTVEHLLWIMEFNKIS